jgi:hypothetical protein
VTGRPKSTLRAAIFSSIDILRVHERPSTAINLISPAEAGMGAKHSFTLTCARIFATQAAVHTLDANRECCGAPNKA